MNAFTMKEELDVKKKLLSSVNVNCLPDKGARLKKQIVDLESALQKLTLSSTMDKSESSKLNSAKCEDEVSSTEQAYGNASSCKVPVADDKNPIAVRSTVKVVKKGVQECKEAEKLKSSDLNQGEDILSDARRSSVEKTHVAHSATHEIGNEKASCNYQTKPVIGDFPQCYHSPETNQKLGDSFLSFADLRADLKAVVNEPPLVPKSPAFTEYRAAPKHSAKVKYTDALFLPGHLVKERQKCQPSQGSFQEYDPRLAHAKQVAVESIHKSLVTCPSDLEEETNPDGLKTNLMKHQRQALTWLLWRETQEPSGGIFADDMGLGKTLTMISLILKSKEQLESSLPKEKSPRNKPTLVVCLASVLHQWDCEISKHCKINALKVMLYHGAKRKGEEMGYFDVVLTTYNIILSEGKSWQSKKKPSALFTNTFQRIILDEAHTIKNYKSQTAQWVFQLNSISRWAVTGTPIHNDLKDMYCLLKYLRCKPFDDYQVWKKLVNDFSDTCERRRNALLQSILLRRTKDEKDKEGKDLISLPKKSTVVHAIELPDREMNIYNQVYSRLKPKIDNYFLGSRSLSKSPSSKNASLLVMLLKLQQCCNHPCLVKFSVDDDSIASSDSFTDVLSDLSSLSIDGTNSSKDCSLDLSIVEEDLEFGLSEESAKIKFLLENVRDILEKGDKVVIVSQWVSMLDVVSFHLKKCNIIFHTIKGSTKVEDRSKIIVDFNSNPNGPAVLLLSLKAGGVGLNLVGGNHMFLLDLHYNPALEMQASDRIYRVGQKKDVFIHKIVCKKTIEEKIFDMQEQKKLISKVVLEGAKQDSHLTISDLKQLFNI